MLCHRYMCWQEVQCDRGRVCGFLYGAGNGIISGYTTPGSGGKTTTIPLAVHKGTCSLLTLLRRAGSPDRNAPGDGHAGAEGGGGWGVEARDAVVGVAKGDFGVGAAVPRVGAAPRRRHQAPQCRLQAEALIMLSYIHYTPIQATIGLGASQQRFYDSLPAWPILAFYIYACKCGTAKSDNLNAVQWTA